MSVLDAIKDAAPWIGITIPTAVFAVTDRTEVELAALAKKVAVDVANEYEWQALAAINTFTGDGTEEDFALPADYDRMPILGDLWNSVWKWQSNHITSTNEWLAIQTIPVVSIQPRWIVYGGEFHFQPAMANLATAKFFYLSSYLALTGGVTPKLAFTADTDTFRLPERLLRLGIIWQWKSAKGAPFAKELEDYNIALAQEMTKDGGSKPVIRDRAAQRDLRRVKFAWPGTVSAAP